MKLLIAGGGTGGHVFPAIAVAREWLKRGEGREVVIVGTERGLEAKLVPQAGLPLETIRAAGLKGVGGGRLLRNAAVLPLGMLDSAGILRRHRVSAAFGVGGYASGPMMLMAALSGVPTVIFEPNAEPGFANKALAPFVRRIAAAHEEAASRSAGWGKKAVVTGCPVRAEFFEAQPKAHQPPFTILITGGSQGALPINRAVVDALDLLAPRKKELFVIHQSGERDYNAVRVAYARREFNAEVLPFLDNMAERFAQADLIVCRSGAITVAEIAAAGRAAIFIPFAAATDSHQLRNAQVFASGGAAKLIPQPELTPQRLSSEMFSLLDQPKQMTEIEERARALARPRAVEEIVDLIEEVARKKRKRGKEFEI
ncbi:MAG: undecaprenyldiphospho-muramoylpentapeptide beta-N-acetylglucosaminyltransferase [Acidobacteria bacterium]|nr:undecaprenyldiphospho-muramoylpentapeptide beta-N-acetylglucosaminyltransferase [Acidobacteriota bacterium]MBI3662412.1 undecaprenyldiphospho-muramoylpentapeptide beta-N-acetylglucosaminyltransferase [Acidobacteriota bacterium]